MNVIDSSFWFEYYTESKYSDYISKVLEKMDEVIVPTIVIVEVFKKLLNVTTETNALKFIAQMKKGKLIDLNFDLSLSAAYYGKEHKLPLADSIIYATTLHFNATLYTMDNHFEGLKNVEYFQK
ncbi:MAG: vapC [Ignavibacteria bacterium]|nr:vapC [Ignavibacteria bacterium]